MKYNTLKELLSKHNKVNVDKYIAYCQATENEVVKKTGKKKNPWMHYKTAEMLSQYFNQIDAEGLVFDGVHITLQFTGISLDYVAFKNKMLLVYPETKMDISVVYKGDKFSFSKNNGKISYNHDLDNPFEQKDKSIIGAYCVIKNNRGEFLTTLSIAEIDKHRKVAKGDFIWKAWFKEMCFKTISKKACKQHFNDDFQSIETMDNENYDLEQPLGISIDIKSKIEKIKTTEELTSFYNENKGSVENVADFHKAIMQKTARIEEEKKAEEELNRKFEEAQKKAKELEGKVSKIIKIDDLRAFYEKEKGNYDLLVFKEITKKRSEEIKKKGEEVFDGRQ